MNLEQRAAVNDGLRRLMTALANVNLYEENHQQVTLLCEQAREQFSRGMAGGPELSLFLVDDKLICNNAPLELGLYAERFIAALKSRKISHLRILSGVTAQEIRDIAVALSARGKLLEVTSSEHLRIGAVSVEFRSSEASPLAAPADVSELPLSDTAQETLFYREIIEDAGTGGKFPMSGMTVLVADLIDRLRIDSASTLAAAFSLDREQRTVSHATSVAALNLVQAMSLGIDGELLRDFGTAGMLHDIGKLFIPPEILEKESMDDADREVYRHHTVKGALYLLDSPWVPRMAVITALDHHHRYDGSGYPSLGTAWSQNLCSRITAISDLYDALYLSHSPVFARISTVMAGMAGTVIHPGLTQRFLELMARQGGSHSS